MNISMYWTAPSDSSLPLDINLNRASSRSISSKIESAVGRATLLKGSTYTIVFLILSSIIIP